MSDFAWIVLAVIVYILCRTVLCWRARKTWDE